MIERNRLDRAETSGPRDHQAGLRCRDPSLMLVLQGLWLWL